MHSPQLQNVNSVANLLQENIVKEHSYSCKDIKTRDLFTDSNPTTVCNQANEKIQFLYCKALENESKYRNLYYKKCDELNEMNIMKNRISNAFKNIRNRLEQSDDILNLNPSTDISKVKPKNFDASDSIYRQEAKKYMNLYFNSLKKITVQRQLHASAKEEIDKLQKLYFKSIKEQARLKTLTYDVSENYDALEKRYFTLVQKFNLFKDKNSVNADELSKLCSEELRLKHCFHSTLLRLKHINKHSFKPADYSDPYSGIPAHLKNLNGSYTELGRKFSTKLYKVSHLAYDCLRLGLGMDDLPSVSCIQRWIKNETGKNSKKRKSSVSETGKVPVSKRVRSKDNNDDLDVLDSNFSSNDNTVVCENSVLNSNNQVMVCTTPVLNLNQEIVVCETPELNEIDVSADNDNVDNIRVRNEENKSKDEDFVGFEFCEISDVIPENLQNKHSKPRVILNQCNNIASFRKLIVNNDSVDSFTSISGVGVQEITLNDSIINSLNSPIKPPCVNENDRQDVNGTVTVNENITSSSVTNTEFIKLEIDNTDYFIDKVEENAIKIPENHIDFLDLELHVNNTLGTDIDPATSTNNDESSINKDPIGVSGLGVQQITLNDSIINSLNSPIKPPCVNENDRQDVNGTVNENITSSSVTNTEFIKVEIDNTDYFIDKVEENAIKIPENHIDFLDLELHVNNTLGTDIDSATSTNNAESSINKDPIGVGSTHTLRNFRFKKFESHINISEYDSVDNSFFTDLNHTIPESDQLSSPNTSTPNEIDNNKTTFKPKQNKFSSASNVGVSISDTKNSDQKSVEDRLVANSTNNAQFIDGKNEFIDPVSNEIVNVNNWFL